MAADKNFRRAAAALILILFAMVFAGQFAVYRMAEDYKAALTVHDSAVAGALSAAGIENGKIASAFVSDKTKADTDEGRSLLTAFGYNERTRTELIPLVAGLRQKYALYILFASALFSAAILTAVSRHLSVRDRQVQAATAELSRFLGGDTSARLSDCGEGSLSSLFAAVNAMATSLTAHIETEKQNRQSLKNTISDISHQLKTPLAALSMYNDIIDEEQADAATVARFAQKSRRELNRMEGLILNLMKLARLDAGTIELSTAPLPLCAFLSKRAALFDTRATREGKTIKVSGNESTRLCFDEVWLGEAVDNIVKNALDHTKFGDTIEISCVETAVTAEIVISDSGEGIHPEDIHHIFKRFYRSRYSKDAQGVGIGLAIAKSIVDMHGGTVTVQSELGAGTRFYLTFPHLTNM
ncbi:Adaptive-response sensory-kinase SasA [bioreactor metagenome]|uniref:histidine kinase n=1 Tax=bioreactor metagenome TaxID=1076179 RepID=A0A644X7Q9_9ZZZZ